MYHIITNNWLTQKVTRSYPIWCEANALAKSSLLLRSVSVPLGSPYRLLSSVTWAHCLDYSYVGLFVLMSNSRTVHAPSAAQPSRPCNITYLNSLVAFTTPLSQSFDKLFYSSIIAAVNVGFFRGLRWPDWYLRFSADLCAYALKLFSLAHRFLTPYRYYVEIEYCYLYNIKGIGSKTLNIQR